jgi:hypothetical protein
VASGEVGEASAERVGETWAGMGVEVGGAGSVVEKGTAWGVGVPLGVGVFVVSGTDVGVGIAGAKVTTVVGVGCISVVEVGSGSGVFVGRVTDVAMLVAVGICPGTDGVDDGAGSRTGVEVGLLPPPGAIATVVSLVVAVSMFVGVEFADVGVSVGVASPATATTVGRATGLSNSAM